MLTLSGVPTHPFNVGVTLTAPMRLAEVELAAVNVGIFPEPVAPSPIEELVFVHVNVAPVGLLSSTDSGMISPLHAVSEVGTTASGLGFTTIVVVEVQVPVGTVAVTV